MQLDREAVFAAMQLTAAAWGQSHLHSERGIRRLARAFIPSVGVRQEETADGTDGRRFTRPLTSDLGSRLEACAIPEICVNLRHLRFPCLALASPSKFFGFLLTPMFVTRNSSRSPMDIQGIGCEHPVFEDSETQSELGH